MDAVECAKGQEEDLKAYEARCKHCGLCCGAAGGDPCANLRRDAGGRYYCANYDTRIGTQRTVSGASFTCVPIRVVFTYAPPFPGCGYV